jgi:hypothetical protein
MRGNGSLARRDAERVANMVPEEDVLLERGA